MKRTFIADLKENEESKICGIIERIRDSKNMIFIVLRDTSDKIQITIEKQNNDEIVNNLTGVIAGSSISATGKMVLSQYVKMGGKEFLPTNVEVLSHALASPITEDASIDQRINFRWIDLKTEKNNYIFKIQSCFTNAMREFLVKNRFVEIHTPKLIGAASESGSDVFEVKYFDRKAYLAQSPQFYKQMAMSAGFDRIFESGPVFRAEQSFTNRHATEFSGFDLEFSYIDSVDDVMSMEEDLLIYALDKTKKEYGEVIKNLFGIELIVPTKPFPRMKLCDVYKEIEKYGYKPTEGDKLDLSSEAEKLVYNLAKDKYNHEFMFITDYPKDKRAFYHMRKDGIPQGYDLIWRGVEITTGAQREHRYEILKSQAEEKGLKDDVQFYLDFFKYGCPPHGGFGLGLDRIIMLLLGIPTIKEAEFLFRGPNRLNP